MWIIIKKMGCCLLILILLPYVVTVFINGPVISARSRVDQTYIKVEVLDAADDTTSFEELPLEEFGIGVMAGEIPAEYEEEALKAQAVLVRTDIYRQIQEGKGETPVRGAFWDREDMRKAWNSRENAFYKKNAGYLAGDGGADTDI